MEEKLQGFLNRLAMTETELNKAYSKKIYCRLEEIDIKSRKLMIQFDKERKNLDGITKPTTRYTQLNQLATFAIRTGKPFSKITDKDVKRFFINQETKPISKRLMQLVLQRFFSRTLKRKKVCEYLQELLDKKVKQEDDDINPKQILTYKEILRFVGACNSSRDRALIHGLYDSGARIDEWIHIRVKDIEFNETPKGQKYAIVYLPKSKTRKREVPLTRAVTDLKAWIREHPLIQSEENPFMFIDNYHYPIDEAIGGGAVYKLLQRLKAATKIRKPGNPHWLRHSRITEDAILGVPHAIANNKYGWEKGSQMYSRYTHIASKDVLKDALQRQLGEDIGEPEKEFNKLICPECSEEYGLQVKQCKKCGWIFDGVLAGKTHELKKKFEENVWKQTDDIMALKVAKIGRDALMKEMMKQIIELKKEIKKTKKD